MSAGASINSFRDIRELELRDLSWVCPVSGKNDAGKSTIWDAVFLLLGHASNNLCTKVKAFRGSYAMGLIETWKPLVPNMNAGDQSGLEK